MKSGKMKSNRTDARNGQKTARVARSAKNSLSKFARALTYEAASNMSRMANAAHSVVFATSNALEGGDGSALNGDGSNGDGSNGSGSKREARRRRKRKSGRSGRKTQYYKPVLSNQPRNPIEGAQQAVGVAAHRMKKMARTIVMLPVASYQKRGLAGATRSVVRAVPVAILEPIQIVTETVSRVTLGLRNWVDPAKKEEEDKKWKRNPKGR